MPGADLLRDALEVAVLVALGGMVGSAFLRLRSGRIDVHRCPACSRPTSRAYPDCRHCGVTVRQPGPDRHDL